MATAKKAAAKSKATKPAAEERVEHSNALPEVRDADAMPAQFSEAPNGEPSDGPDPELGMTMVQARPRMSMDMVEKMSKGESVMMSHPHGHEAEVAAADVEMHKRAGWTVMEE